MTEVDVVEPGKASARRGPGRPRAIEHDKRVLDAVLAILETGEEVSVRRVVTESGVSRAAIYRRWPSVTDLVAAALDRGRAPYTIQLDGVLLDNLLEAFLGDHIETTLGYSEERLRTRLRLSLADRELQQKYWSSHVRRRRNGLVDVLREGIARGELRADLDLDACCDLVTGVFYYQLVVRGDSLQSEASRDRCREAVMVAWRGMQA